MAGPTKRTSALVPHAAVSTSIDPEHVVADTALMPRKSSTEASPVAQFETSLDALEHLVDKMEKGEMSLEESLAAYERGVGLYRSCQSALEQAELRVRLLSDPQDPDSATTFDPLPDPSAPDA